MYSPYITTRTHGHTDTRTHGHTDTRTHGQHNTCTCRLYRYSTRADFKRNAHKQTSVHDHILINASRRVQDHHMHPPLPFPLSTHKIVHVFLRTRMCVHKSKHERTCIHAHLHTYNTMFAETQPHRPTDRLQSGLLQFLSAAQLCPFDPVCMSVWEQKLVLPLRVLIVQSKSLKQDRDGRTCFKSASYQNEA